MDANQVRDVSVPEVILQLLLTHAIDEADAKERLVNFQAFEEKRPSLEAKHAKKWVASVDGRILAADSYEELERNLISVPNATRAYIEHIGSAA